MYSPHDFRPLFPHIREGSIYLNHAALSPLPEPSVNAALKILRNRQTASVDRFDQELPVIDQCRQRAAELIGAGSPESIAFVQNTSTGLSYIANGLGLEPGDEILLYEKEFPSNVYPWKMLEKNGITLRFIQDEDGTADVRRFAARMTEKTKVVAVSGVQFLSGYRIDLQKLGSVCRKNNTLLVVDAIQAAGPCEIEAAKWGIDALCCGGHKWLMAPRGIGFMYASPELTQRLQPCMQGWLSVERIWDFFDTGQPLHPDMKRFEPGTYNIAGIAALSESLRILLEAGRTNVSEHVAGLNNQIRERLLAGDMHVYGSASPEHTSGIVTFMLPENQSAKKLTERLTGENIFISARDGKMRISPYFYTTPDEASYVADMILKAIYSTS